MEWKEDGKGALIDTMPNRYILQCQRSVLNGHQTLALKQTIKNLLKKGRENYETHKLKTLPYNEAKKVACHMADGTPRSKFHPRKVKKNKIPWRKPTQPQKLKYGLARGNVSIWFRAWLVRLGLATESFRKLIWLWLNIAVLVSGPYHTPPTIINKFPLLTRALSPKNKPTNWWADDLRKSANGLFRNEFVQLTPSTRKKWNMDL